jgi:heme oxygenase
MAVVSTSPALELIRAATADGHRRLESALEIGRAVAGEGAYVRYLEAVLGWLAPIEPPLWSGPWPAPVAAPARDGKVAWLEADLRARGRTDRQISALPRQRALPPLATLAECFGVAYVVEGAQLGGQVLLRRLGPRLAPRPARWLEGYGADSGARWRSFGAALGAYLCQPEQARSAAEAARRTFELVHGWFARQGEDCTPELSSAR